MSGNRGRATPAHASSRTHAVRVPTDLRIPLSEIRSVLVYGVMGVGNMIMMTPALRALRTGLPEAHIALLVDDRGAEAVVTGGDLADEVLTLPSGSWRNPGYTSWLWRNVRGKFDLLVIPPHGTSLPLAWATFLSRAPHRLAVTRRYTGRAPLPWLYNHRLDVPGLEHEAVSMACLVEHLGIGVTELNGEFVISEDDERCAEDCLGQGRLASGRPRIVVHATSSRSQAWKRWPTDRFLRLCERLREEQQAQLLFVGSSQEREEIVAEFADTFGAEAIVAGKLDLKGTAALVKSCDLVVANDSAISHIAAATGTPLVVVFGPTDERICGPMAERCTVVTAEVACRPCYLLRQTKRVTGCTDQVCLSQVGVAQVHEACVNALEGRFGGADPFGDFEMARRGCQTPPA